MRSVRGVLAGITLIVTLAAVTTAASPTSADPPPTPDLPAELPLPAEVPDLQGLPDVPVDVPAVSGLSGILECITGATSDLSSPTGLVGPVQCILEKLLELVGALLGGVGDVGPELPVDAPALP